MRKVAIALVTLILASGIVSPPANAVGTPGQGDASFNANFAYPLTYGGETKAAVATSDGSVIVGGSFTRKLAKLNSNGTSTGSAEVFNSNVGESLGTDVYQPVEAIAVLSSGAVVVGGSFPGFIKMYNSDGTTNSEPASLFNTNVANLLDGMVYGLLLRPNDSILIGGDFTDKIKMINSDGTTNSEPASVFNLNVTSQDPRVLGAVSESNSDYDYVRPMVAKADGSIIVGGNFTGNLRMFNGNGTATEGAAIFNTNVGLGVSGAVRAIAIDETNNAITFGGEIGRNRVKRLNLDGTDSGATTLGFNRAMILRQWSNTPLSMFSNIDGSVLIGGAGDRVQAFNLDGSLDGVAGALNSNLPDTGSTWSINSYPGGGFLLAGGIRAGVGRINADGSISGLAGVFNQNSDPLPNERVQAVTAFQDGYLLGGEFTGSLLMINEDGSSNGAASNFNSNFARTPSLGDPWNGKVNAIYVLDSGKILIGGEFSGFLRMINSDGTATAAAATFNAAVSGNVPGSIKSIVELPNGSIVVGGYFSSNNRSGGYLKMFNPDGSSLTGLAKVFNDNVSLSLSNEVWDINAIVSLEDGFLIAGGATLSASEVSSAYLRAFNFDGTIDTGAALEFNVQGARTLEIFTDVESSTIKTIVALPDGRIVFGGSYYFPGVGGGYVIMINDDGSGSATTEVFNNNANAGVFNGEVINLVAARDGSMVAVGDFDDYVKRINADGTVDVDSGSFNTSVASILDYEAYAAVFTRDGSVVVGGAFRTPTTRNIHKFFGAGYPVARKISANTQQSNSQPSPSQTMPQPSPPQGLPTVNAVQAASFSVIFSSGSKDLVTRYQKDLKVMVEKSGLQAKYTVNASASMVRGLPRSYVSRLASARAAKIRLYLIKLGVSPANITTKLMINKIGQTPTTKITVK